MSDKFKAAGYAVIDQLRAAKELCPDESEEGVNQSLQLRKTLVQLSVDFHQDVALEAQTRLAAAAANEGTAGKLAALTEHRLNFLDGCIFAGHTKTDLDSVAGAIAGAELHHGLASISSEVNSETEWALKHWGFECPSPVEDVLAANPEANVCLVDFQQLTQLNPAIAERRVVGVIDHHALQSSTIVCDHPIYVDIRPWGSMCSILAHNYLVLNQALRPNLAGLMLSAILSDTLNLRSPTTTDVDAMLVAVLARVANVSDCDVLAAEQFQAKSANISAMSDHAIIVGDMKVFEAAGITFGFGVIETTDAASIKDRKETILNEMQYVKQDGGLDLFFFAIIDIVNLQSDLLVIGEGERSAAAASFGDCGFGSVGEGADMYPLGNRVSRKKDFVPALTATFGSEDWSLPSDNKLELPETELVMHENSNGFLMRQSSQAQ